MIASGSCRTTSNAASPMQGAVSRLQGSLRICSAARLRQLLGDGRRQPAIGHDPGPLGRDKSGHAVDRRLDHRACADQRQQLFGPIGAAGGPEPGSRSASHDYRVQHESFAFRRTASRSAQSQTSVEQS